jgi:predicted TIM-barrel fold metal-dependent hydrolase
VTSTDLQESAVPKIWAHSGDSHFLEPEDLYKTSLPPAIASRLPRSEIDGEWELVHVDGEVIRRRAPNPKRRKILDDAIGRPPGARNARERLKDLDAEGIWGEVVYPSVGLWNNLIKDPGLMQEAIRVGNDFAHDEIEGVSPRFVCAAQVSTISIDDAVDELQRCAALGFRAICLPSLAPPVLGTYNREAWEPLWTAAEEAEMVVGFHIGTDYVDVSQTDRQVIHRGPGGALLNYMETTFSGQRCAAHLASSGALERHPDLKVLISEGGATWVPFLGDRLNEAYRQHAVFVRPKLSLSPKEYLYRQVYTSFQHDESAIGAFTALGYPNVMFGTDYPHLEGTYGHTQETLHHLFDGVPPGVRRRITMGTFNELFPHVPALPEELATDGDLAATSGPRAAR